MFTHSSTKSTDALSGSSPIILPGHPPTIENGGMTVSCDSTVFGSIQQQSFTITLFDKTHPSPIKTEAPIAAASMTQAEPIRVWFPILRDEKITSFFG